MLLYSFHRASYGIVIYATSDRTTLQDLLDATFTYSKKPVGCS